MNKSVFSIPHHKESNSTQNIAGIGDMWNMEGS